MSEVPEQLPSVPENAAPSEILASETFPTQPPAPERAEPLLIPVAEEVSDPPQAEDDNPLLFQQFFRPEAPPQERIPHLGHLFILALIALCALFIASLAARAGVHFHLFGASTIAQAATEIHYTLGTEGIFYVLTFAGSLLIFPLLWQRGLFAGLHWRGATAMRLRVYLLGAAAVCFLLALVDGMLMPGPPDAPIDRIFRMPGAAWMLFGFGVTLAPFFEEIAFRGFLLPALSTAFDWVAEKTSGNPPRPLDQNGHPQWSMPAMLSAAGLTSLLFAFMHADQTGYSLGPFLLLIAVSLVLSAVRLITRSLAASVLVHAGYNFFLFSLMFLGTSGFKHLENM